MIAIIILNWNNAPDTLECLESVYTSDDPNYSVIVVDNGSVDDSLSIIQKAYPQARYLLNKKNLGFAEGCNGAMQLALDEDAKYIFLLNNDAAIAKNTLSILRKTAEENPNAAVLGPVVYYDNDPATIWSSGMEWDPHRVLYKMSPPLEDLSTTVTRECICGCAFFLRASHLRISGLFDPRYFLNWEEIDLCCRLKKLGFECLVVGPAKAWHKISRSFIGGRGPMWYYFYSRNRLLWMKTHLPHPLFRTILITLIFPQFLFAIRHSFHKEVGSKLRATLAGTRDYFLGRFGRGPKKLYRK